MARFWFIILEFCKWPRWVESYRSVSSPLAREADVPPLAWIGRKWTGSFKDPTTWKRTFAVCESNVTAVHLDPCCCPCGGCRSDEVARHVERQSCLRLPVQLVALRGRHRRFPMEWAPRLRRHRRSSGVCESGSSRPPAPPWPKRCAFDSPNQVLELPAREDPATLKP
jgi:hypothetical protein